MSIEKKKAAAVLRRHLGSLKFGAGVAALAVASSWTIPAIAQETTSSMNGSVVTADGAPATGTIVEIIHTPSGTRSVATVNAEGRYTAAGLRVGGPYNVRFTPPGDAPQLVEGVFISLGKAFSLDLALTATQTMEEIVVTGDRLNRIVAGTGRSFGEDEISNSPTVNRDLKSTLKLDPRVSLDPTNLDAISIAGTNNRFNQISVDGVRQSDDFGLNNNGYPTQRSPISLDAIEQLAVVTNPFDVEYTGFQGGLINIVTKSGTNDFHGSAFYYYTDGTDLTGDRSKSNNYTFDYKEKTYGGTLGGPIIEDKLFFFGSYEKLDAETPQETGPSDSSAPVKIPGVTQAEYNQVLDIANRVYNYDAGALGSTLPEKDEKILARVDWNIIEGHRATMSYQRTKGNGTSDTGNSVSSRTIATLGHLYDRSVTMDQYAGQIFSDWSDNFSTELKFGRKEVVTGQVSLRGTDFAEMEIRTAAGATINIGPDEFRHANELTNDLNTYKAKGEYLMGDHALTFGFEREELEIFNLFVPASQGFYIFNSIADFEARRAASLRYGNALSNNADDGAAQFGFATNSLYLEDKWQVNSDFELTYGLRYDWFKSGDAPNLNPVFTTRYGYDNLSTLDGLDLWSPRVGFKYEVNDDTTLSGGAGIFGGGTPNVWISNSFSNDGVSITNQTITRNANGTFTLSPGTPASATLGAAALNNVNGFTLPAELESRHTQLSGQGDVNAVAPGFNVPSEWQFSLTVDHKFDIEGFGDDWQFTATGQYAKTRDAVIWDNARYVVNGTLPDGRPRYVLRTGAPTGNDLILTNTDKGSRLTLTAMLNKEWETDIGDITTFAGYTYQDSKDVNPATSSTALSNWDNIAVSDMNNAALATSNYEIKHRIVYAASIEKEWITDLVSTLSVVGESRSGRPYSFTFRDGGPIFNDPRQNTRDRQLFYVPGSCTDVTLVGITCDALNDFIARNGLEQYRGQIVPRNSHSAPWVHQVDLAFKQEIPSFFEGHKAAFTLDIRNVGNLINSDWGRLEQVGFPSVVPVTTPSIGADGKYVYTGALGDPSINANAKSSVWQIQVGVRYEF